MSDNILTKLKATADILGGDVFFATSNGTDPEYPDNGNLLENGMYIRLKGSDGSLAYVSAFELNSVINNITAIARLKANQSDVNVLQELLEGKASDTDIKLLQNDLNNKADKSELDELTNIVNNKADKSELNSLTNIVNTNKTALDDLTSVVNAKASKSYVDSFIEILNNKPDLDKFNKIVKDIELLKTTVSGITDSNVITSINTQIDNLNSELRNCLDIDDLLLINEKFKKLTNTDDAIKTKLDEIDIHLSNKASNVYVQNKVNEINSNIVSLSDAINNKASKVDVAVKANKTDLDYLVDTVTRLNTTVSGLNTDLGGKVNLIESTINSKVEDSVFKETIDNINEQLNDKSNNGEVTELINRLTDKLNNLTNTHSTDKNLLNAEIDELECTFNNLAGELRALSESQNNKIANQNKAITNIQNITTQNANQLKQTWVRVLSTNEYKNLNKLTDDITIYNPRYKYPNTVYFVVDFNIPKAIYIGDILIAKANQNGPVGFSYNFPITF